MPPSLSKKVLDNWIGSIITGRDRNSFPALRKQVQAALVQTLLVDGIAGTPVNGDVAYALMLLLVGRGIVPQFREMTQGAHLPGFERAAQYYHDLDPAFLSRDVATAAILARTVEVTNEFVFGTIENAILILNEGVRIWPEVGELRRQSGVIALAQGRYADALADLEQARTLNPAMVNLNEPLDRAIAFNTIASAAAAGNYTAIIAPTFHRTPFQVLLLEASTFGLYTLYYLIRNYHLAQIRLNDKRRPWWGWLGLLIPIVNIYFVFYNAERPHQSLAYQTPAQLYAA